MLLKNEPTNELVYNSLSKWMEDVTWCVAFPASGSYCFSSNIPDRQIPYQPHILAHSFTYNGDKHWGSSVITASQAAVPGGAFQVIGNTLRHNRGTTTPPACGTNIYASPHKLLSIFL